MKMKKLSLLVIFGVAVSGLTYAQSDTAARGGKGKGKPAAQAKNKGKGQEMGKGNAWKNPEVRADSNARRMQRNVGLSQAQYEQVRAANMEYYSAVAANRETYKGDEAGKKAANKAAYEVRENKLKAILTADQYTALQKYRSDIKARKSKGKSEGKGKPAGKGKPEGKGKPAVKGKPENKPEKPESGDEGVEDDED